MKVDNLTTVARVPPRASLYYVNIRNPCRLQQHYFANVGFIVLRQCVVIRYNPGVHTTRIVATIGPASRSEERLNEILSVGVDVIRFNMSHGQHAEHDIALKTLKKVAGSRGIHTACMADLCGPKIRTNQIDPNKKTIEKGQRCVIVRHLEVGDAAKFATNTPAIVDEVEVGHRVLIDDGCIRLRVIEKKIDEIVCECEDGGEIDTRKGINLPDSSLSLPSLTSKDLQDVEWIATREFDFVALSFAREATDITQLRNLLAKLGVSIPIVSKIETAKAIENLDEIIDASDVVLVARGDLGVELEVHRLPILQKEIVHRCRLVGKPVIVATQMLHSMVHNATPTRAEVSDVANAVLEGADTVMLSAETAVGSFPVESVEMMHRICDEVHAFRSRPGVHRRDVLEPTLHVGDAADPTTSAIARSAVFTAHDIGAKLLAVWSRSGKTAQWMSKYRGTVPLVGLATDEAACRRMAVSFALEPMLIPESWASGPSPPPELEQRLASEYALVSGDLVVVVGDPVDPRRVPTLRIHMIGD